MVADEAKGVDFDAKHTPVNLLLCHISEVEREDNFLKSVTFFQESTPWKNSHVEPQKWR